MKTNSARILLGLVCILALFISLTKPEKSTELTFNFSHTFNGDQVQLNKMDYTNTAGNVLSFTSIRYLISGITLSDKKNGKLELKDEYGFIDLSKEKLSFTIEVPKRKYNSLSFTIGLPNDINIGNPYRFGNDHPLDPITNNMHWNEEDGYIFMTLEGLYKKKNKRTSAYVYHIAMDGNQLNYSFNDDAFVCSKGELNINFELSEMFNNPLSFDIEEEGSISHSIDDGGIVEKLKTNAKNAFTMIN